MTPSYRIVFYISGHGFGHTSRMIEVIRALAERRPDAEIAVRTSAPRRLFDRLSALGRAPLAFSSVQCDTGMVQADSLSLDVAESIRQATAFHAQLPARAATEAEYLREIGADVVVGDIPALAFAAAAVAGVPSVAIGNFTWDWIYEGYPEYSTGGLVQTIRDAYRKANVALRLPMSGGFAGLDRITRDIPFIARRSTHEPAMIRQALGIPNDRPVVLVSFGAYGLAGLDTAGLGQLRAYTIVGTDHAPGLFHVAEDHLHQCGLRYEDLVRASDVVVTKPGYGIISEAIANHTAMLYTSRGPFREYDVLVREMPKYLRVQFIEQTELLAGRWGPPLDRLLSSPMPPEKPALNGAEIAADGIARIHEGHEGREGPRRNSS
jgi:UDP:flavonoid glycosyltransferase YjiC (YdhE family)